MIHPHASSARLHPAELAEQLAHGLQRNWVQFQWKLMVFP